MTQYVRGQSIRFTVSFTDVDDQPYTPDAASITIKYPATGSRQAATTIELEADGSDWVATWDSGQAARSGTVYWTVYASSPDPKIADDGSFTLAANSSNLVAI